MDLILPSFLLTAGFFHLLFFKYRKKESIHFRFFLLLTVQAIFLIIHSFSHPYDGLLYTGKYILILTFLFFYLYAYKQYRQLFRQNKKSFVLLIILAFFFFMNLSVETIYFFYYGMKSFEHQKISLLFLIFPVVFFLYHSFYLTGRYIDNMKDSVRVRSDLRRRLLQYRSFFPGTFLTQLGKTDISELSLGDHVEKKMTILFADIRDFTALSEKMTPLENFQFINGYLGRMGPVIRSHSGFIDKYIGDAIMALFPGSCDDAVKAAIQIQEFVKIYNSHRKNSGYPAIKVGIGIHTGNIMLGIIGESKRMEGTVISDAVNLASRLESLTKEYGCAIIISNEVMLELNNLEEFNFRILDRVKVKGKEKEVSVIEIFDGLENQEFEKKQNTKDMFEQGLIHYHLVEYDRALECFKNVLSINPDDTAAELYYNRCIYYTALMGLASTD